MTHYRKNWFKKLAIRLFNGQRVIIEKHIYAQFLCHCIKSELLGGDFNINVIELKKTFKINPIKK